MKTKPTVCFTKHSVRTFCSLTAIRFNAFGPSDGQAAAQHMVLPALPEQLIHLLRKKS